METVKMRVPEGCGGCSHGGAWFSAVKGFCEVPATAVKSLMTHGWSLVSEEAAGVEAEIKHAVAEVEIGVEHAVQEIHDLV